MNVQLDSSHEKFVAELVASGEFPSPAEVINEGLRLLQERQEARAKYLAELRSKIAIGIEQADRGEVLPFDAEAFKQEARRRLALRQAKGNA